MSRIEQILEKAEREGTVRRVQTIESAGAMAGVAARLETPAPAAPALIVETIAANAAAPAPAATSGRVVERTVIEPRLIAATTSTATAAEQYRALRTRILHADTGSAINAILVSSPGRSEGRTLTAANLALTMAQEYQRRICLVDADLRHPQVHRLFGIPQGPGLADVLAGEATLEDGLVTIEGLQMTILPAGHRPERPAELLGTTAMRRTLDGLRSQFDRVVVDAPAVLPLADVGILAPLVDGVLLVVRAGATSKPAIHDAIGAIDGSRLLGIVLNEAMAA
jgi:capsular exopolysaccharide synthesis family protein